jgi:hypothetical protein
MRERGFKKPEGLPLLTSCNASSDPSLISRSSRAAIPRRTLCAKHAARKFDIAKNS